MVERYETVDGARARARHHCSKAAGAIGKAFDGMIHAPLFDKHDPTTTVSTQWMSIYEGRLNHGSKKSIPYFEGKNNPVKHILALCSILWQGKRGKVQERAGRQHALDALPRYATQCRIAAKRCFTTAWGPIALNQPGSVELCQDMLHRSCLHG